ncbi:transcriptional regulator, MerR family [Beutenbergia cavernae DSM 12333]|uniref:Transcriptional regulator, MerR family n=1 Tax=Beutenbergia cavernae (strain ATCC BAA-8 / DSM 12333 / CCUG 43141 / JCM 11478 / NBRC 16432 / NCIMB 13614 / HKI 0122) TaxID=471853 RepID=C5C2C4_BEUC1|nr:MerR family transcriptional regulator [Beutenbergia cavernae]ACQ81749.1 transcriptional regulator, MerR family [Beutenbergia cavernae DSM 12333]
MTATIAPEVLILATEDDGAPPLGISAVAERTGLSADTLRWYEREGLLPPVARSPDGRRRYGARAVRIVELVSRLRRTGMPVEQMREFAQLVLRGPESYERRLDLLAEHRTRLLASIAELQADLTALDEKTAHYTRLIAEGSDCLDEPTTHDHTSGASR